MLYCWLLLFLNATLQLCRRNIIGSNAVCLLDSFLGSFLAMAHDPAFLRTYGINTAWFCADPIARKYIFGSKHAAKKNVNVSASSSVSASVGVCVVVRVRVRVHVRVRARSRVGVRVR